MDVYVRRQLRKIKLMDIDRKHELYRSVDHLMTVNILLMRHCPTQSVKLRKRNKTKNRVMRDKR